MLATVEEPYLHQSRREVFDVRLTNIDIINGVLALTQAVKLIYQLCVA